MSRPKLAVIIPAYNEEDRILRTLERLEEYFAVQPYPTLVVVVSDGSSDRTCALVQEFVAKEKQVEARLIDSLPNHGKGFVVRKGMLEIEADWLLMNDADLATPIEEIEKLWPFADQGIPVIIGSRPLRESNLEIPQPLYRELLGRAFNKAVQTLGIRGIQDTQCGFKLFRYQESQDIFRRCTLDGFGFDFESLMIARDLGLQIAEVPIRWRHQEGSKVRVVRDGLRMLRDLVKLRIRGKAGRLRGNT